MEKKVMLPIHIHPLLPFTRFSLDSCDGCRSDGYVYGGYRCNEFGCERNVYHKECAESLPEINHSSHPDHPLKLLISDEVSSRCSRCQVSFWNGYFCSICDFKLDMRCAKGPAPLLILENSNLHHHPLQLSYKPYNRNCKACDIGFYIGYALCYTCDQCKLVFHVECAKFFPEANHTSHPQHPLKLLSFKAPPDYADKECLLCGTKFDQTILKQASLKHLHHCIHSHVIFVVIHSPVSDVRCSSISEPFVHQSHRHPLYYIPLHYIGSSFTSKSCTACGDRGFFNCDECNFTMCSKCAILPYKVIRHRYDDHPLFLSYGESNVDEDYWCEACETKVNPRKWFYTCKDCGVTLHISCVVGRRSGIQNLYL